MDSSLRQTPITSRSASSRETETKLLLVDARGALAVERHPRIVPWRLGGWTIRSAEPRIVEGGDPKLLVVLEQDGERVSPARPPSADGESRRDRPPSPPS